MISDDEFLASQTREELIAMIKNFSWQLKQHEELLQLIPECPVHGECIPHAKEWVLAQLAGEPREIKVYTEDVSDTAVSALLEMMKTSKE